MTREELEMRTLVRESDVIDRTDGSELAKAFNHLWDKYVEQAPKMGHWIPVDDKNDAFDCSECIAMVARKTNYCPRCGAKMEDR